MIRAIDVCMLMGGHPPPLYLAEAGVLERWFVTEVPWTSQNESGGRDILTIHNIHTYYTSLPP